MSTLIDDEIAHIKRVMWRSMSGDLEGQILSSSYWRRRLNQLLDSTHLAKHQLEAIDRLLRQLDQFDAGNTRIRQANDDRC